MTPCVSLLKFPPLRVAVPPARRVHVSFGGALTWLFVPGCARRRSASLQDIGFHTPSSHHAEFFFFFLASFIPLPPLFCVWGGAESISWVYLFRYDWREKEAVFVIRDKKVSSTLLLWLI